LKRRRPGNQSIRISEEDGKSQRKKDKRQSKKAKDIRQKAKMRKIKVKIQGRLVPQYQSEMAAGCDLCADISKPVTMKPGAFCIVPTGIRLEIPRGYEAQVRPRSGLAVKHGVGILNAPGTIDADYRGEVRVILFNFGTKPVTIKRGERIAQMIFAPVVQAEFMSRQRLRRTARGRGGFGHTGR
jgi:dUTP pyrophosphatase